MINLFLKSCLVGINVWVKSSLGGSKVAFKGPNFTIVKVSQCDI
jgi:hypothetical protein